MKRGNNTKVLILSMFMLSGFAVKTASAQTDSTMPRTDSMQYTIVDLYTGQPVEIAYNPTRYITYNRVTGQPIDFYVVNNVDTVMGPTGLIVNGMLLKEKDGKYKLDNGKVKWDGKELKMKESSGRKVKWEKGKMQIKDWNGKSVQKGVRAEDAWNTIPWRNSEW